MLNHKQLEQTLKCLDEGATWFFMCLDSDERYKAVKELNFTDLLKLPKPCLQNLIDFFSTHYVDDDYNSLFYGGNISQFIKDATGLELRLFLKLVENQNRKDAVEKDFI